MKVHFMNLSLGCSAASIPWPAFPQAPVYPQGGQMQGEDKEGSRGDIVGLGWACAHSIEGSQVRWLRVQTSLGPGF